MLPAAAFTGEHVASEIKLMQALHNNDLDAGCGIIDAAAKSGIKTQVDRFPFHLADGLLRVERIVKDKTSPPMPVAVACMPVENIAPREEFS